jgi:SpoVK/Ycf46/Vps4 family AAA+-type ATPase
VDNDWTFIMLDKAQGLGAAIEFARTYQPCVIFAEDIDRYAADRDDDDVNKLVNLLDGMLTKDNEMMVVLTTNFIDNIDPALLRPGRFDAIISIEVPDADTAIRLVRHYARELIPESVDLSEAGNVLSGQIPATIREVVERSKVLMLMEDRDILTADDLLSVATDMAKHIALLEGKPAEKSAGDRLVDVMSEVINSAGGIDTKVVDGLTGEVRTVRQSQSRLAKTVTEKLDETNAMSQAAAGAAQAANETTKRGLEVSKENLNVSKADLATTEKVLKAMQ